MSEELKFDGLLEKMQQFVMNCYRECDIRLREFGVTKKDAKSGKCHVNVYVNGTDEYRTFYYGDLPLFYTHIWFDKPALKFRFHLENGERPKDLESAPNE